MAALGARILSALSAGVVMMGAVTGAQAQSYAPLMELLRVEPEWPMPADIPVDTSGTLTNEILVYTHDKADPPVPIPLKTIKITNMHTDTVYPILRDGNEAAVSGVEPKVGLYDPWDPVDREYRGYIGYEGTGKNKGKYFFGIPKGKSVLIRVPLVFWNGARMSILTDGRYLTPSGTSPNPMHWDPSAQKIITVAETDPNDPDLKGHKGVVLWYTSALNSPALDAPDQLVEWTIRDKEYLSSPGVTALTHNQIPESEKVDLINYDVSYVDNMYLPVAMEALDVPIPAPPYPPGRNPQPHGWVGAIEKVKTMQDVIEDFTKEKNNRILGDYFAGKGWPKYNIPQKNIKIPAAQNVFAQSPLADTRSSYQNNAYMLSSGGSIDDPIFVSVGGAGSASSGDTITLSANYPPETYEFIKEGYLVVANTAVQPNPIPPGTTVVTPPTAPEFKVKLSNNLVASEAGAVFDFYRPATDYATTAMVNLWFSWAAHYLTITGTTPQQTLVGSVELDSPTLKFSGSQSGLIPGMEVSGPGLPQRDPAKEQGGVIVLSVATDGRSVLLSQIANETHTLDENQQYTFKPPQPLTPVVSGTFKLDFSNDKPDPVRDPARVPAKFAEKVYLVMASMNQIPKNPDPNVKTPYLNELMNNVVGGNMGFIFPKGKETIPGAIMVSVYIRDTLKSILRGVTDFTRFPEWSEDGKTQVWYPDPKIPTGGQPFNVFNLDPFVRFVHVNLGFSGYGFSLDDDTADVGAGQATKMLITIGGRPPGIPGPVDGLIKSRANPNEWTIQAPYGTVKGRGYYDPNKSEPNYHGLSYASNTTPIVITSTNHGLGNDEVVNISEVQGNTAANGTFRITNVTADTFELVGSSGNGEYTGGGKWDTGPMTYIDLKKNDIDDVYWRIKGDDRIAGFQGAFVITQGVLPTKLVRVQQLGDNSIGRLYLSGTLTIKGTKQPLPAGNYSWLFSGTRPGQQ